MAGPLDFFLDDLDGVSGVPSTAAPAVLCSRAGCRSEATAQVNWRNPRIHGIHRVKVWLACEEHRVYLRDYLGSKDFPVEVTPIGVDVSQVGAA